MADILPMETDTIEFAATTYVLPMLININFRVDADNKFRFQLSREDIPLTPRLRFNWMLDTDKKYMAGFRYVAGNYISLSTHYDSNMSWGAGVVIAYS